MKRKKLTPKQRVLRKHRRATVGKLRRYTQVVVFYRVYKGPHQPGQELGEGLTPRQAWADALRTMNSDESHRG